MPQSDQMKGMLDRAIAILATVFLAWLVKKGWIGESDAAAFLPAIVLLPSLAWGAWVNRRKALLKSAAAVPGTVVVTTPELAKATPNEKNILSSTASTAAIAKEITKQAVAADLATPPKP